MRAIFRMLAFLVSLVALAAPRQAWAATLFDEDGAIAHAIGEIRAKSGGANLHVFEIEIRNDDIAVIARGARDPGSLVEWRYERNRRFLILRESVSGPRVLPNNFTESQIEANVFDLDAVDFTAANRLIAAAPARAHFAGPGRVTGIEIKLAPLAVASHSGEARWTVSLAHEEERAEVYADADGEITGADIGQTRYARTVDMRSAPDQLVAAARALAGLVGPGEKLTKVEIHPSDIRISTNVPDTSRTLTVSGKQVSPNITYDWSASGMRRVVSGFMVVIDQTNRPAFAVDDVDWAILPRLEDAARQRLDIADGKIGEVTIGKSADGQGTTAIVWTVAILAGNGEVGTVTFDTQGHVKEVTLPPSRRPTTLPVDWRDPSTLVAGFGRIEHDLGADARFLSISAEAAKVTIVAADPRQTGRAVGFTLGEDGLRRDAFTTNFSMSNATFTIADLKPLTVEKLKNLESRALERMRLPADSITEIVIGRGGMDRSPKGNVAVTIRAGMRGPTGRMVYELDGTVIKAYPPEDLSGGIPPPPAGSFAGAYMDCGNSPDVDRMIEACTQVILAPNAGADERGFAFTNRGIAFGRKGWWDRDIADETEAIRLAPNYDYGYTARGRAYGAKGDLDRALADYDEAVRLAPTLALTHGNRATIYLDKGDIDRAIADADTAIRLDPDAIGPRRTRGAANLAKGDLAAAIADYTAALRINDDDLASYGGRARAYLMLRDDPHAFADYDAAIQRAPGRPAWVFARGRGFLYAGEMTKARKDFDTANALDPTFAYPTLWRVVLDARTGAPDRAKEMSGRFDAKAWPAPVFRFLAGELTQEGLVAAAADPDPWTRRGQICEANFYGGEQALARGRKDDAARLFGLAKADCPSSFIELEGAQVELARLGAGVVNP